MKVLLCTDGSDTSFYAIKMALKFLPEDCNITVINVMDWGIMPTYVTFPAEEEEGFPGQKTVANEILDRTAKLIEDRGYKVTESEYSAGRSADVIIDEINEDGYNFAVLGSHGKKGIRSWLGSVSRKVVTKSPIPTFISRPPKSMEEISTNSVLFMVDGSENSYNAIRETLSILNLKNYSVEVLTVKPGPESLPVEITMDNEWLENCLSKQADIAREILDEAKKIFEIHGIAPVSAFSLEGDPADVLLKYASENPKDLIIMGSHGREGITEFLLGSVSKRVLDNVVGSVFIVPSKRKSYKR